MHTFPTASLSPLYTYLPPPSNQKVASPVAQYEAFCKVSAEFLRPSSPQEINISSKLQTHMLSFRKR